MKKNPESESHDPMPDDPEQLREYLKTQGLTEDQISEMILRLNPTGEKLEERRKEPTFFYEVYEEKLGRPLTDVEKIQIKAELEEQWKKLKAHFGLDDEHGLKKQ
jgi:hypothetical protein